MIIDTGDMVGATEAARNASSLFRQASEGRTFVVVNNNSATAAIVGVDRMEELQRIEEEVHELRLLALAAVRVATDSGERFDLDDVLGELGVDLTEA